MHLNLTSTQWLQVIILPILFVVIGMLAKRLGRKDGDDSPRINDWAVSTSIILMTFGKIAADLVEFEGKTNPNVQTHNPVWWLFGVLLTIFISIEHDRFRSWKKDENGLITKEKSLFVGIILPNFASIMVFISYHLYKFMSL